MNIRYEYIRYYILYEYILRFIVNCNKNNKEKLNQNL